MTNNGEFNWMELQTHQPESSIDFYRRTLGWEFRAESMPTGGTYWIALASDTPVCGFWTLESNDPVSNDHWVTYIHVENLDQALHEAQRLGAEIMRSPWDVPGVGRVAMVRDPGGAEMGWVTPLQ